jgi:hypothetical protein
VSCYPEERGDDRSHHTIPVVTTATAIDRINTPNA